MYQNHLQGLLKHRFLGSIPTVADSVGLMWDPTISFSNKFLDDTDVVG